MKNSLINFIIKKSPVPFGFTDKFAEYSGQNASDIIMDELDKEKPSLICKIGYTELNCILSCTNLVVKDFSLIKLILKNATNAKEKIAIKSGFFPNDDHNILKFSQLLLDEMQQIDILGTWLKHEKFIKEYVKKSIKIKASDMEPYFHANPWTKALKGKKILVIHPFESTIKHQYLNRDKLFENINILPEFELKTLRAIQSRENNKVNFNSWWDAFEYMKNKIAEIEFDVAILGCGSYSLPLGAHIKRTGKKAIHLGGATQILFGIIGSRWEARENFRNLFNDYWIRPLPEDIPSYITKNDSYW